MSAFNHVVLVGNLTRDPDIRDTHGGKLVANIRIAVNSTWKDKGGDKQEEVLFMDASVWGNTAEVVEKYLNKGDPVLISGRLIQRKWKDKEDNDRETIEVSVDKLQLLGNKRDGDGGREGGERGRGGRDRSRGRDREDADEPRESNARRGERQEREREGKRGRSRDDSRDRDRDDGDRGRKSGDPW